MLKLCLYLCVCVVVCIVCCLCVIERVVSIVLWCGVRERELNGVQTGLGDKIENGTTTHSNLFVICVEYEQSKKTHVCE